MPLLPHPTWPVRQLLICGVIGVALNIAGIGFQVCSVVHYIIRFW